MSLEELFTRCLNAKYIKVENDGSYATERRGDILFLFFEHSNGRVDWKNNLDFPSAPYKRMDTVWRCHRGFLRVWRSILPYVEEAVRDKSVKKIVCVGFSHGGAIATLAHEYVWYERKDLRDVIDGYGFGAPRVFFGICSGECAKRWERYCVVRNDRDAVTYLPPSVFGFSHVGNILQIGNGCCNGIDAHRPESYIASLREYESEGTAKY